MSSSNDASRSGSGAIGATGAAGDACVAANDCAEGLTCIDDDTCAQLCDRVDGNPGCPTGTTCDPLAGHTRTGVCR